MIEIVFGFSILILIIVLTSNIEKHFENAFGNKIKEKIETENKKIKNAGSFEEVEEIEKRIIKLKREKTKAKLPLIAFNILVYSLIYYWFYLNGFKFVFCLIIFSIVVKLFYKKYFLNT